MAHPMSPLPKERENSREKEAQPDPFFTTLSPDKFPGNQYGRPRLSGCPGFSEHFQVCLRLTQRLTQA